MRRNVSIFAAISWATRRRVALLGVVAILFQAVAFGWHHHPVELSAGGGFQSVVRAANSTPLSPALADHDCEICAALHHFSATPWILSALFLPGAALAVARPARLGPTRQGHRPGLARAPPLVEISASI